LKNCNDKIIATLEKYTAPILLLTIRLWMANIFFKSGLVKISNIDSTINLFEYEYALPIISPVIAAYSSIVFELGCATLLAFGLASRLMALPLIGMALTIQFLVFQNTEHFYWIFLLSTILVFGGGKISLDAFLRKIICKFAAEEKPSIAKRISNFFKF
jgi:putative oxidoreductase